MRLTDLVNPRAWNSAEVAERNITVADLLHQTSGIRWNETYAPGTDATEVTFGLAQNDTEAFVAAHPQDVPAGETRNRVYIVRLFFGVPAAFVRELNDQVKMNETVVAAW